ncbi:F-box/FBD/LRR-repeat protein At1g13570-like isoform X2 [Rhododendron vialii]|uniref:F-box/FBD/LRR-repeat protein At1g13570-like isoform X2 n=1 Tax=Rhododendron vialii TaxID=182163 RepID=UPI00265D87EF|nr:F-box/FBD/LRR-repeat protein At1g13570-like isoform X2 [Rhododendron vialii]
MYELPPCIFSCQQITHLCINHCLLKPPLEFKGFNCLVYGPNLKYLCLEGNFGDIHLENCSLLTGISFQMTSDGLESHQEFEEGSAYRLIQALGCLCGLRRLTFSCVFLKACNDVHITHRPINFLDKLQANCYFNALRVVEIKLHGYNSEQNSIPCWRLELEVIKFLLSRSPILEKMIIQMFGQGIQLHRLFMGELLEFERASPRVVITFFP